jgi:hypothetical protein
MDRMFEIQYDDIDDERELSYEVSEKDLVSALADIIYDEYIFTKELYGETSICVKQSKGIEKFINEKDLVDTFFDAFYEELKERFRNNAIEQYKFWRCM